MELTNVGSMHISVPQGALLYEGTQARCQLVCTGDKVSLLPTKNMSVSVRFNSLPRVGQSYLVNKRYPAGAPMDWRCYTLGLSVAGQLSFAVNHSGSGTPDVQTITASNYTVIDGEWTHVTCVHDYDISTTSIYVNGDLINSMVKSGTIGYDDADTTLFFGGGFDASPEYSGQMCDIKIWSGNALTASEVEQVYNGIDVTDGLVAHWKHTDREGTTLTDVINGYDTTLVGSPTPEWVDRDIKCWGSRWDEGNWDMTCETFIDACDRNYLFENVIPGAVRELYNILGTPNYIDTTYESGNTIIITPLDGYGISSLRRERMIGVKNISDTFINKDVFGVKIEGYRLDIE